MPMKNIVTPELRVSFPAVINSREVEKEVNGVKTKVMEYSMTGIFAPGTDLTPLKKLAKEAIIEKLGADESKWPPNLRNPIRKCEERIKNGVLPDGYPAGGHFISLRAKQKPGLVDQNLQPILDESQFYAGCYARAQINAYYYDQKGNKGVAFGLQNVQKLRDGDSLSGRVRAEDAFEPVAGATEGATGGGVFD